MSTRNHKAIFERKAAPLDHFGGESDAWSELCREWVSLEPLAGRELFEAQQVQSQITQKARLTHSPTAAGIRTHDRFKIALPVLVNEDEPNADENFRIFEIESIVNVREQNRELELMVIERV